MAKLIVIAACGVGAIYAPTGSLTTYVIDLYATPSTVPTYSLDADLPDGTSVSVTASQSSSDGATWSSWSNVDGSGALTSPANRYWRLKIALTSADPSSTPVLRSVTLTAPNTTPANWSWGIGGAYQSS